MCKERPPGWGDDSLSGFINRCLNNTFASYTKYKGAYSTFININNLYQGFISVLQNKVTASIYVRFMLLRSHCSFLGAVQLALNTQVVESYMVARGCLEAALYGLHMRYESSSEQIWIHRHDNDDSSKKKVRNEFGYCTVANSLRKADPNLYAISDCLYQRVIDYGGHPNERAITANLKIEQLADSKSCYLGYLADDEISITRSFKTVADIGMCALKIFGLAFPDEFRDHGINTELAQIEIMISQQIRIQNP